ncbi:Hypothetical protein PBC10988_15730 [Planctomycetales bacterium 10988]|nr:Hypothetical protein PBC10988_15730 [Planctomycetales bacterium 10988]
MRDLLFTLSDNPPVSGQSITYYLRKPWAYRSGWSVAFCLLASWLFFPSLLQADPPKVTTSNLYGLQIGAKTTLDLRGINLAGPITVLSTLPEFSYELQERSVDRRAFLDISLPADTSPGIYPFWIANAEGISSPILLGVDHLKQAVFQEQVESLPISFSGRVGGPLILKTTFEGQADQQMIFEVESTRLGSDIRPVLELQDANGIPLAWGHGENRLGGDVRMIVTLPTSGKYTVKLHDLTFKGGRVNQFRLKIGSDLYYTDLAFPLGTHAADQVGFELLKTNLPEGYRSLQMPLKPTKYQPLPQPPVVGMTGPSPAIFVSDLPDQSEAELRTAPNEAVTVPLGVGINGRISQPGEVDRYRIEVTPGTKFQAELVANRMGSELDAVMILRDKNRKVLLNKDDQAVSVDPVFTYQVPKNVNEVFLEIRDLLSNGGEDSVYRLELRPSTMADFHLTFAEADAVQLLPGGSTMARIAVERNGYNGRIQLRFAGVPDGVEVHPQEIPAKATEMLVTFTTPEEIEPYAGLLSITGTNLDGPVPVTRPVLLEETQASMLQPWLRNAIGIATGPKLPFHLVWEEPPQGLPKDHFLPLKLLIQREEGHEGGLRFKLATSQKPPQRRERNRFVTDVEKTLRLKEEKAIDGEQNEVELTLMVPADLPGMPYDFAIKAEMLNEAGNKVIATASTPVFRLTPQSPLQLKVDNQGPILARLGAGETGEITGEVVRTQGFNHHVLVRVEGLPNKVPPLAAWVFSNQSKFSIPVHFPQEMPDIQKADLKVVALSVLRPELQSNPVPIKLDVQPGSAPEPLGNFVSIFEDQPEMAAWLSKDKLIALINPKDPFSGKYSLRVLPPQVHQPQMPGWAYAIRENPGPGEFRYLRFAWKKVEGARVLLQFNANGAWGARKGQDGPEYRYLAGEVHPRLPAITVSEKIPSDWQVVTRDLFADFGEFTLNGLALTPEDGKEAGFDHIGLARSKEDFPPLPGAKSKKKEPAAKAKQ